MKKESEDTYMYHGLLLTARRTSHVSYFCKYPPTWPLPVIIWPIDLLPDNMEKLGASGLDKVLCRVLAEKKITWLKISSQLPLKYCMLFSFTFPCPVVPLSFSHISQPTGPNGK